MSNSFYQKSHMAHLNQLKDLAPEQLQAFASFNEAVLKEGALTKKEKEIIAVAIAHVTECPYCIDSHTRNAKAEGASLEELTEAVFVVAGIEAGGAVTHSTHMHGAKDAEAGDALYLRSNLKQLGNLSKYAPEGFKGYAGFNTAAMKAGKLSVKFKEIIAVAVAHGTQCPYCIEIHTQNADKEGATNEELSEAVLVTSALLAGGAYAHMANMIESYGE
ncbi:AhpD family alkylhydroperoxidase [Virgibacillus natechei]|uniref:AhpD family alkylhydroperoxidase n=1 Tax=Virgibacillus natechei TaxID=1216297 RepID=A0ABS4IHZ9_9BACI|nr:carboxymuconolactone decarboxylase family protein [Virgibacillus natechei]MBP1970076.1 AhpD family alkylhydroperoxidase [Virgibacillus natechei]UZD14157.1 carboxymuconolactone decarboxylase family protein [Virgibacillus natechei]